MQDQDRHPPTLGLDVQVLMDATEQCSVEQRQQLAAQVAAFLCSEGEPQQEREQLIAVALRLAADASPEVREVLARGLSGLAGLHPDLLFAIVSDDDNIALPFLCATPALTQLHMLSVLRVGDEARQAAILSRPDVTTDVIDFVVKSLPLALNRLLLKSDRFCLTSQQFQTLYDRFSDQQDMTDLLLARPDLPASIRILQVRRAATSLQGLLSERDWLQGGDAAGLIEEAEENAVLELLGSTRAAQLPSLVSFLVNQDILTPSIIVRAACRGDIDIVTNCLAILAHWPVERVRQQVFGSGNLRTLIERAGLPQSCHWPLRAVCDVAHDQRLDGVRLTSDEFGSRVVEALMTRYAAMPKAEQPRSLDVVSRYASGRARLIARRLKDDLMAEAA
ncbi:DUF2336 domain-containing protein [Aestuariivirga sp.]|jgi:uncharacterized protein (DUF2336 family)|uniref:DUF2336 domain-containing protein n=1 Tax=Aestuariivirga sp. TaxID=2650926 RepID=UPI003783760C